MPSQLELFGTVEQAQLLCEAAWEKVALLRCQRCEDVTMTKARGDTYGVCPGCGAIVPRATRPRTLVGARG